MARRRDGASRRVPRALCIHARNFTRLSPPRRHQRRNDAPLREKSRSHRIFASRAPTPPPNDESRLDGAIHFPRSARVDGARAAVETARRPNRRTRARHSATPRAPLGPLDSRARLREGSKGNKSRTLASKVARKGATRDARTRRDEVRQRNQTRRALGISRRRAGGWGRARERGEPWETIGNGGGKD